MSIQTLLTLGDFRRMTKDLPDDTAIVIEGIEEEFSFHEAHDNIRYFVPSLDVPGAIILSGGQEITEDHHMIPRLDVWLEYGGYLK